MRNKKIARTFEEWENLPREEKNKLFSHPRWHEIPVVNKDKVIEPEEITDELRKQREESDKMVKKFIKKLNLPKRPKPN